MKCPFCGAEDTAVADTRLNDEADVVRRRRKCNACDKRFTTYERAEIQLPQVVKKNGLRTEFSRGKLRASLAAPSLLLTNTKACFMPRSLRIW